MAKYKEVFDEMVSANKELLAEFKKTHDQYSQAPDTFRKIFNEQGEKILILMRRYESRLCKHSENSGFGKFSTGLSGKFWEEVKKIYPLIDEVGLL